MRARLFLSGGRRAWSSPRPSCCAPPCVQSATRTSFSSQTAVRPCGHSGARSPSSPARVRTPSSRPHARVSADHSTPACRRTCARRGERDRSGSCCPSRTREWCARDTSPVVVSMSFTGKCSPLSTFLLNSETSQSSL
eukprot:6113015-Pleurochrysis_carterae.AAC.1